MNERALLVQKTLRMETCIPVILLAAIVGAWLGVFALPSKVYAKDVAFVQTMELGNSHWSLQDRSRVGLGSRLELTTALAGWLLASPNLGLRAALFDHGLAHRLHGEVTLGLPTPTVMLTRGYLFPRKNYGSKALPWMLVPGVSLTWAVDLRRSQWTLRSAIAYGVLLSGTAPSALDTYAPIELALAPLSRSFRGDLEAGVGIPVITWMDVLMRLRASLMGLGPLRSSPWIFRSQLGVQFHLGDHWSLHLLASWYNYDQGRIRKESIGDGYVRNYRVRSNEVWPTFGVIWRPCTRSSTRRKRSRSRAKQNHSGSCH